jgi:ABC-type glycerol-3-phosphate transport system substrate-binding protein
MKNKQLLKKVSCAIMAGALALGGVGCGSTPTSSGSSTEGELSIMVYSAGYGM